MGVVQSAATLFIPQLYIHGPISVLCSICTVTSSTARSPPALCGFEPLNARLCSPHLFRLPLEPALSRQVNSVLKCMCFSSCPICLTCLSDRDNPLPDVCSFPAGRVWTCRQTCTRRPKVTQFVSVTGATACRAGAISPASLLKTFLGTFVTRNLISCLKNPLIWFRILQLFMRLFQHVSHIRPCRPAALGTSASYFL